MKEDRQKRPNIDTMTQQNNTESKKHTRKRKKTSTEEDNESNSEDSQKDAKDKSAQEEGKVEGQLKHKKSKNKQIRHQQISDSSLTQVTQATWTTTVSLSDNDIRNGHIRKKPVESRKGIG